MSSQPNKKEALGKGIRTLLQHIDADLKHTDHALSEKMVQSATGVERIPLELIELNPKQPRHDFDETALRELSESIKLHDVIQPITVSRINAKKFRLISGERRLRAARMASLKDIPAYIRQVNDQEILELALLENIQRENLNAIEIGLSLKRLMDECELNQEQVAERMGKERSTIANYIRLLKLPPDIQVAVRNGQISMGHARAIINIGTVDNQLYVFKQILQQHLSVRQVETLVKSLLNKSSLKSTSTAPALPPAFKKLEDRLSSFFSTKVKLQRKKSGQGTIQIEFYSDEDLTKIIGLVESSS